VEKKLPFLNFKMRLWGKNPKKWNVEFDVITNEISMILLLKISLGKKIPEKNGIFSQ